MNDCIFCRIIAGEIPSERVYEDDKMIVIRDVAPAAPVHVLMIPKAHTENIITAEPELLLYMFGKVKELAEKLGVNEKIAQMVIDKFKKDILKDLNELESFIEECDMTKVSQKAHYVKNSCLNVALSDVCDILQKMENVELNQSQQREMFEGIKRLLEF